MSARGASFAGVLAASYATVTGEPLVPAGMSDTGATAWLYEAPFALLAHDTSPDPLFVYANLTAQAQAVFIQDRVVDRVGAGRGDSPEVVDHR